MYFKVLANVILPSRTPFSQHHKIFLQQHNIGGFLGDIYGVRYRNTHIGGMQRRCVVNTIRHITDDVPGLLERKNDSLLLVRLNFGKDLRVYSARSQTQ